MNRPCATWVKSELRSAGDGDGAVTVGDAVEALAVDGLTLRVRKSRNAGVFSATARVH